MATEPYSVSEKGLMIMKQSSSGYGTHSVTHAAQVLRLELASAHALFEGIGTPRALTCALLLKNNEWDQLLNLSVNSNDYLDHLSFMDDYQVTSLLQKNPRLPTGINRERVALDKFYDAETVCSETNKRILNFISDQQSAGPDTINLVVRIQTIIQRILSAFPSRNDLEFAEHNMQFGPGSTTSLSGIVTQGAKFNNRALDCTEDLVSFRVHAFPHQWKASAPELNIIQGSRTTTVPKNAKTNRVICVEPDLNIYVQAGIGRLLREKLRRFGLDLSSQALNQSLASRAWDEGLATVDLSAASDTISIEVVKLLLPPAWVHLLAYPRCSFTKVEGKWIQLEKWSSMGNGYTFELETLIFFAMALACCDEETERHQVSCYGDDIIIPAARVPSLMKALDFLGFKVNAEKTFSKGVFYESCGTDWFMGQNVRPFFFRSEHHDFPSICYLYANNARRWSHRRNGGDSCDARCLPLWLRCFRAVKPEDVHYIPEGYGDVGFISDFDRAVPTLKRAKHGWEGYRFSYRRIGAVERVVSEEGSYLAFLSGKRSDFKLGFESLRGRFKRAVKSSGLAHAWSDLGPWL